MKIRHLFLLLWAADTALTCSFVSQYGLEAEANPLIRSLIENFGLLVFVLAKATTFLFYDGVMRVAEKTGHKAKALFSDTVLALIMVPIVIAGTLVAMF